jgi:hypothetical protein
LPIRKTIVLFLVLVFLACGMTIVTIRIDIHSFLSGEELMIEYGTDPVIPWNIPEVSIQTPIEIIPLPEEINSITDIEAIEIRSVVEFRNETGSLTLTYRVYFHSSEDEIFNTPPVIDQIVVLGPQSTTRDEILIIGDQRILNLFEGDEIAMASEIVIVPGEGQGKENIRGEVESVELTVQITAVGER